MPEKNLISELSYKDAEALLDSVIIEKNHKLLNGTMDNINESVIICENPKVEICPMRTEIFYIPPNFLKDPTDDSLKIVKRDIEIYKENFEDLSKEANEFTEKSFKMLTNLYEPSNNIKSEVNKLLNQFEENIKNLCAPLISKKEGIEKFDLNKLNEEEKDQFEYDKLSIIYKINDFLDESDRLNKSYSKLFKNINEAVQIICEQIKQIPHTVSDLQDSIEKGMSNFEEILENFTDPNDYNNFHQSLLKIKNSFIIINEKKEQMQKEINENINNLESQYHLRKKGLDSLREKANGYIKKLKSKSDSIKNDIINLRKKYSQEPIELPDLNASDIIINLIIKSLDNSIIPIKNENNNLNEEIKNFKILDIIPEKKTSIDLLFIMDITGSMERFLDQAKNNIINIVETLPKKCPGIMINLGFIGYRDVDEIKEKNYVDKDFTHNYEELKNSIKDVFAEGGGDEAEDIAWAIERALDKSWKNNARFAILFADCPCHGNQYHNLDVSDNFPNGVENRRNIEELIEELANKNISLYCTEITNKTKEMYDIFKDIYKNHNNCEFHIVPLNSEKNLLNVVVENAAKVYSKQREKNIY